MSSPAGVASVVIPFYNRERLLPRAVASVRAQTYPDWEIVLVDDGSTDRSSDVAARLAAEVPGRIQVLRQPNRGPNAARNLGIAAVRGEFIGLLDSDDKWKPTFLERTTAAFALCPTVDWVYCDVERLQNDDGTVIQASTFSHESGRSLRGLKVRRIGHLNLIEDDDLLLTAIVSTIKAGANSLVRRRVFDRVRYNAELRLAGDMVLNVAAIAAGVRYGYIDEVLMTVYHHSENISVNVAGSAARQLSLYEHVITSFESLRSTVPLGVRERKGLRRRLGNLHLELAKLQFDGWKDLPRVVRPMGRAFLTDPLNPELYRSVLRQVARRRSARRPPDA